MTDAPPGFPKRLVEGDDVAGKLIRSSLRVPVAGPNESQSFLRVNRRVKSKERRLWLPAAAAVVVAAAAAGVALAPVRDDAARSIRAEGSPAGPARSSPARPAATDPEPPVPELVAPPSPPRVEARRSEPARDTARCATLAREGSYDAATRCYDEIARGRSMAAELALYEKARLQSKALGDSASALATLDEHARRFPTGVLATESSITRIELLSRLGRVDAALGATEQALQAAAGRERGGDLQALRADLSARRGDCEAALEALSAARAAGVHGARLEASERRCAGERSPAQEPAQGSEK